MLNIQKSGISLEGEDVCVCVGFCADDAMPRWAGRIAMSGATTIICLYDPSKSDGKCEAEKFAQTLGHNLPSMDVRRQILVMSVDEWNRLYSVHKDEQYSIVHIHIDPSMQMPLSVGDVKPRPNPAALSDFDDIAPLKETLLRIVDVFSKSPGEGTWPSVLLLGETGSGKTYAARRIYDSLVESGIVKANDDGGKFVSLNCGEFGSSDMNAALFGIKGGAFTDVRKDQPGAIEESKDGVLFLDEIGTLPLDLQPRLLTVLDGGKYRKHGAPKATETARCRFIFGTNEDLVNAVRDGRFRFDLYNRIGGIEVHMPSVKERIDGTEGAKFLDRQIDALCMKHGKLHLTKHARTIFVRFARQHPWLGNFRELNRTFLIMGMKSDKRNIVSASAMGGVIDEIIRNVQSADIFNLPRSVSTYEEHPLLKKRADIAANDKAMLLFAFKCASEATSCQDAGRKFFDGKKLRNWSSSFSRYLAKFGFCWAKDSPNHVAEI